MGGEEHSNNKIQAFDALFTTNHIQMYKVLLSYLEPDIQKKLAIYIKYLEFQYTLSYFKAHPYAFFPRESAADAGALICELLPYCNPDEKKQLKKIGELLSGIKNAQEMMDTLNTMRELFPEGFSLENEDGSGPDISQLMQMMELFGNQQDT